MVFIPFILRFLNLESTLSEWVALLLGSEDERKATQAGNGESGKHASKSGNYWKLVETELP